MDPDMTKLREISQRKEDKYHMMPAVHWNPNAAYKCAFLSKAADSQTQGTDIWLSGGQAGRRTGR